MLFSTYLRKGETNQFRASLLKARSLYLNQKTEDALEALRVIDAENYFHHTIFLSACSSYITLLSTTNYDLREGRLAILASTVSKYQHKLNTYDPDIVQDIYSMLSLNHNHGLVPNLLDTYSQKGLLNCGYNVLGYSGAKKSPIQITLPKTGFFSFIEHIALWDYFAMTTSSKVYVNVSEWPFPVKLNDVIRPNAVELVSESLLDVTYANASNLRDWFFVNLNLYASSLSHFKTQFYGQIHASLLRLSFEYNLNPYIDLIQQCRPVFFVRRGDKLKCEAISPRESVILASMNELGPSLIISDDISYCHYLCDKRGDQDIVFSYRDINGYTHHTDSHNLEAFWDVALKWLAVVNADILCACPSSNLVSTAFFVRSQYKPYQSYPGYFIRPPVHQ